VQIKLKTTKQYNYGDKKLIKHCDRVTAYQKSQYAYLRQWPKC